MNKKVQFVDLVFENCESARLMPEMFRALSVSDIVKNYSVNEAQYRNGEIHEHLSCKRFSIVINKKGLEKAKLQPKIGLIDPKNLKERLERWKDITHIDIIFSIHQKGKLKGISKDCLSISVPWYWPKVEPLPRLDKDGNRIWEPYETTNFYQKHICKTDWLNDDEVEIDIKL